MVAQKRRNIFCPFRESNSDSSVEQPVAYSLHGLSYLVSLDYCYEIFTFNATIAIGATVRGSNPGGSENFLGPIQHPTQWVPGHSQRYGGRGEALTIHLHLTPRLKKE